MIYVVIKQKRKIVFNMKFIIFDLEFNSGKNKQTGNNINEIIEIGAIKLNSELVEESGFSITIKPNITKKLNTYVKKLTNITEQELKNSTTFAKAITAFTNWCFDDDENVIFSSWSNTDLFVLLENYSAKLGLDKIDFIKSYFDMQKFATRGIEKQDNNQISLQKAAEYYKIDTSKFSLHRAEDDSRVCGVLFNKTFDKKALIGYIKDTTGDDYYKRLTYKPHYIIDINDPAINKSSFTANCPFCRKRLIQSTDITQKFSMFNTKMTCKFCKRKFLLTLKFRKLYDTVEIKKKVRELKPETKKQDNKEKIKVINHD